jgi:two-component system cell cycle response regulator
MRNACEDCADVSVRVLVADADHDVGKRASLALAEFGYRCAVARTSEETLLAIVEYEPDVLIVGANLDGVDVAGVCRWAREREGGSNRYVVALIDAADADGLRTAMLGGVDDFMIRPLVAEQLHARLQVAERFALLNRQLRDQRAELDRAGRALRATARTDALTQLGNQRQLGEDLGLFEGQLRRYGHRYVAATFDLDHLRGYIDRYGQLAADEAIRLVADTVLQNLRTGDRAYRADGSELILLLPEQTPESARIAAERIRDALAALAIPHTGNPPWNVLTVSAGIAALGANTGAEDSAYTRLLVDARAALEHARELGGNRVTMADGK